MKDNDNGVDNKIKLEEDQQSNEEHSAKAEKETSDETVQNEFKFVSLHELNKEASEAEEEFFNHPNEEPVDMSNSDEAVAQQQDEPYEANEAIHEETTEEKHNHSNVIVSLEEKREKNNVEEGIKWLHKAITAGDIESMSEIAYLYLTGTRVPKNVEEGRRWLERAAEAGDSWAMMELGFRLLVGEDFEQNRALGEKWLRRSAECNYPVAMRILGYRLLAGDELEQNIEEGEKWLRKAAEAGERIAMREWGKYLIYGISRIVKN